MFLAMNRFKINPSFTQDFEKVWRERDTFLSEVPGFKNFSLLRGPECEDHVLYVSHSVWESEEAFINGQSPMLFERPIASQVRLKAPTSVILRLRHLQPC